MVGNPTGKTGNRAVHYIGPGHTRVIYEDRILNIRFKETPQQYINKVMGRQSTNSYAEITPEMWDARDEAIAKKRAKGAKKGVKTRKANRIQALKNKKADGNITREEEIALYKLQDRELPKRLLKKPKAKKSQAKKSKAKAVPVPATKNTPAVKPASKREREYMRYCKGILEAGFKPVQSDGSNLPFAMAKEAYEILNDGRSSSRVVSKGMGIAILDG